MKLMTTKKGKLSLNHKREKKDLYIFYGDDDMRWNDGSGGCSRQCGGECYKQKVKSFLRVFVSQPDSLFFFIMVIINVFLISS